MVRFLIIEVCKDLDDMLFSVLEDYFIHEGVSNCIVLAGSTEDCWSEVNLVLGFSFHTKLSEVST